MHSYLPYVDGLRALAVLAVLVYHLDPTWLAGGFAGVDIFFVISGFIVSVSVGARPASGLLRFAGFFYARRMVRILPALVVCLLVTTLATAVLVPPAWLSDGIARTGLAAFFGLSNWVLEQSGRDYFSPAAEFNPFTHTWSLGVEEQFYFVFPLVFFLWSLGGTRRLRSAWMFAFLLLASLGYSAWLGSVDRSGAFYQMASRFWQLAAGVVLYQWMALRSQSGVAPSAHAVPKALAAWASLGLVVYGLLTSQPQNYAFPGALPAVLGTLGLLGCLYGASPSQPLVRLLTWRPIVWVGRISYSLYLWHWPVYVLLRWTVGLDGPETRTAAVVLSFVLATLSWRFVETPLRQWHLPRQAPRRAVVAAGLVCVLLGAGLASLIEQQQPRLSISTVVHNASDWYPHGADTDALAPGCTVQARQQALEYGYFLVYERFGCAAVKGGAPRVFAIGDSHAMGYAPLFKAYVLRTGAPVFVYANGGCPFVGLRPHLESAPHCSQSQTAALADLRTRLAPGDVLLLASLRLPRFSDQWVRFDEQQVYEAMFSAQAMRERIGAQEAAVAALAPLAARGARIVLEGPKPLFRAPPYRCAETYNQRNAICQPGMSMERELLERYRMPVLEVFKNIASRLPQVSVWDPFAVLCPVGQDRCEAFVKGRPLFFDADHLSNHGNAYLLPSFLQAMTTPRSVP